MQAKERLQQFSQKSPPAADPSQHSAWAGAAGADAALIMAAMKCKGLTPQGREKLRQSALLHQPWRYSTGPRTPAGKAQVALNGKRRQLGIRSVREIKADLADVRSLLREMRDGRTLAAGATSCGPPKPGHSVNSLGKASLKAP
jgi:hypothetical protein